MFFVEDQSHFLIGIRVKVEIVRVRDPNSICPSPKASRCDIYDIFVIGRNFEICGGSGGIGPRPIFSYSFCPYTYVFQGFRDSIYTWFGRVKQHLLYPIFDIVKFPPLPVVFLDQGFPLKSVCSYFSFLLSIIVR